MTSDGLNFLIVRMSSLGDVLLTTPLVRCIKTKYPNSYICFVVKKQFADVIRHNPRINKILEYDNNCDDIVESIKKEKKEYIIVDLQNNLTSKNINRKLNFETLKFRKNIWKKIIVV